MIERMISICLTWFPNKSFRLYQCIPEFGLKYNVWDYTWRVYECEELVGVNNNDKHLSA